MFVALYESLGFLKLIFVNRPHEFDKAIAGSKDEVVGQLRMDGKRSDLQPFLVSQLNSVALLKTAINNEDDIVRANSGNKTR